MISTNLTAGIRNSILTNWDRSAFVDYEESSVSYAQVGVRIVWLHSVFQKLHIKPGDKIALIGRNSGNWATTYLATITYGAVIVPILAEFHPNDIQYIINHSDSQLLFVTESLWDTLDETQIPGVSAVLSLKDFSLLEYSKKQIPAMIEKVNSDFQGTPRSREDIAFPDIPNDQLAAIVYTSGTTSFSKGVMLSHNSLSANVAFAIDNMHLSIGDRLLSILPLAHSYGCAFEFLFPFVQGCCITFLGKVPTPKLLLQAFADVKPHLILMVPLILEKIYRKQLKPKLERFMMRMLLKTPGMSGHIKHTIRKKLIALFGGEFREIIIGGAALNHEVEAFLTGIGFPFTIGYGMTECGPLISYAPWDARRIGSAGSTIDVLESKVIEPDPDTGIGEVCVRGENVMMGYYKNDAASVEAIDPDGWLHTGDLGTIDSDSFIYLKGRCKSMILGASGQNIYPEEIEAKLNNMPCVLESVIIERNEKLVGLVYPDMECVDQRGITESDLSRLMEVNRLELNKQLAVYAQVFRIELYPREFEKTPSKKIKRFLYTILSESRE